MAEKILEVKNLVISFKTDHGILHAVRDVSFDLEKGETLCIVGESGSGKSVTNKAIMGILASNAIVEGGQIIYRGEDLLQVAEEEFHKIRGHRIGMIFQDPLSSLNPIMRIGKQITEATLVNGDKLKRMFEDIISDDLIAYKNAVARGELKAEKVIQAAEAANIDALNKNSAENADKKGVKAECKARLKAAKKEAAEIRKVTKAETEPLRLKLEETKKAAKVKVAEYKAKVLADYKKEVASANGDKEAIAAAKKKKTDNLRITKMEAKRRALEIMKEVGIPEPEKRFRQYPFEFSGGMRQRIVIAIALTETPEILICDEPTTALDVTIQGQILELIKRLKKDRDMSVIFITHDLGVVANMADRVAVMYAGKIVEYGTSRDIFFEPKHPYTWALLASIPDVDSKERLDAIPGTPPNMIYPPKGDAFAPRSKYAMEVDFLEEPPFFKVSDTHYAATWLLHPDAPQVEMPKIVSERIKNNLAEQGEKGGSENE
ncbi:MAG: ATP-binding cassette domain-containing protein [Bacilli bacterium]|nr:ATP-binding cassette domain-containing protein [Bacilli bacterium]